MGGRERQTHWHRDPAVDTRTHGQTHIYRHIHGDRTIREGDRHLMTPQQGGGRATKADTQTDGQMGRRLSPVSHWTYSEGSTSLAVGGKSPSKRGLGRVGWTDRWTEPHLPSRSPTTTPPSTSISPSLPAGFSLPPSLQTRAF